MAYFGKVEADQLRDAYQQARYAVERIRAKQSELLQAQSDAANAISTLRARRIAANNAFDEVLLGASPSMVVSAPTGPAPDAPRAIRLNEGDAEHPLA